MLSTPICIAILATIIGTSLISGILGMAGGMILMVVLVRFLTVQQTMIVHSVSQITANGSRVLMHLKHVSPRIIGFYMIGLLACFSIFVATQFIISKAHLYLLLGMTPFLALLLPKKLALDIRKPVHTVICGFSVTFFQMTGGISGPLLDNFYINTKMNRFQIIANKATTQSIGHVFKLLYFGALAGNPAEAMMSLPVWLLVLIIPAAIGGTLLSRIHLDKMSDEKFMLVSRIALYTIATLNLGQGIYILVA